MHHRSGTGRFGFLKQMLVPVILGAAMAGLAPAPTRADAPTPCDLRQLESRLFTLVNQARASAGLAPLTRAPELDAAARLHSQDMAATCTLSHTGSDGSLPADRIRAAGYNYTWAAENAAFGSTTADGVLAQWMNEPAPALHRANILSADAREIGLSVIFNGQCASNGFYWTQDFGARSVLPAADANYSGPTDCTTAGTTPTGTATGPQPTGTEPGTLQLAAITSDGKLWHTIRYTNGNWAHFGDVKSQTGDPGVITDAAVQVFGSGANSALQLCAITSAGQLLHTIRQADGSWLQFRDVASQAGDRGRFASVALANVNNELHVLGVTADGKLWHTIRRADGSWLPFGDVKGQAGDPGSFTRVAATVMPDAQTGAQGLYVLGVTSDRKLYVTVRDPSGAWSPFGRTSQSISEALVECAVTFTGSGTRRYLAHVTLGGQLLVATDSIGATAGAGQIESLGSSLSQPVTRVSIAPASATSPQVQMAVVTADGGLWHQIGSPGAWPGFGDVKGQTSDPGSVVSVSVDVQH